MTSMIEFMRLVRRKRGETLETKKDGKSVKVMCLYDALPLFNC